MRRDFSICQPSGCLCSEAGCVPTEIQETRETLVEVNSILTDMRQLSANLSNSLSNVKGNLEQALTDPMCSVHPVMTTCSNIMNSLSLLDGSIDFDQVRRYPGFRAVSLGQLGRAKHGLTHQGPGGWGSLSAFLVI